MTLQKIKDKQTVGKAIRFAYQFTSALFWCYSHIIRPVFMPFRYMFAKVWDWYRFVWDKWVYKKDGYFSRTRAGLLLSSSVALLYILPATLIFLAELGLYMMTVETYDMYLTQSQEVDPHNNIHSVKGSDSLDATDQNSMYYRVGPRFMNHAWSLFKNGHVFYPDGVAAAIAPGINHCTITSYGIRWKFVMRNFDIYPELLSASCHQIKKS